MTNLWQGGSLRAFARSLAACVIPATFALLLPGSTLAAPHSHARRPLPTALHTTAVAESSSRVSSSSSGKRRKSGLKSKANAQPAGARSGSGAGQGKSSKGRKRRNTPVEDMVPMYRAGRETSRTDRLASVGRSNSRDQQRGWSKAYGPAPSVSSRRVGRSLTAMARYRAPRADHAAGGAWHPPVVTHDASVPGAYNVVPAEPRGRRPAGSMDGTAASAASRGIYAEGIARPADDERLPMGSGGNGEDTSTRPVNGDPASVVRASAAASGSLHTAQPLPAPSSVVQGFGGEIAVPSSTLTDRPGGTRRRSHPANWNDPAAALQSQPLEEREAITEAAVSPAVLPESYDRNGRLLMPSPLKGSHDVLVHQNVMGMSDGLERIYDDADLERLRAAHLLVSLPQSESLRVNPEMPANRRVARPWTVVFAGDLARAYYQRFGEPLIVTSAARTVHFQARLQRVNGNAAATAGEAASPHLTGQAVDFGKRGMSLTELAWMRAYLLPLMQAGKIDVEEEFQQACFHISVYRSYAAGRVPVREYAQTHAAVPEALPEER